MDLTKKIIVLGAAVIISMPSVLEAHCGKKHYTSKTSKSIIQIEKEQRELDEKYRKIREKYKIKESLHEKLNRQLIFCSNYNISESANYF